MACELAAIPFILRVRRQITSARVA